MFQEEPHELEEKSPKTLFREKKFKDMIQQLIGVKVSVEIIEEEMCGPGDEYGYSRPAKLRLGVNPEDLSKVYDGMVSDQFREFERTENVSIYAQGEVDKLVPANVGDFVLIFDVWARGEGEMDVAIVTSKMASGDVVAYGARYLLIALDEDDRYGGRVHGIVSLSKDDHGGHPAGFYKVITRQEALDRIVAKAKAEVAKRCEELNENIEYVADSFANLTTFGGRQTREEITEEPLQPKQVGGI